MPGTHAEQKGPCRGIPRDPPRGLRVAARMSFLRGGLHDGGCLRRLLQRRRIHGRL